MKKSTRAIGVFFPIVITLGPYLVFYSRIESKPNHAGFWFILLLGMSLGAALTQIIHWIKENKKQ